MLPPEGGRFFFALLNPRGTHELPSIMSADFAEYTDRAKCSGC